MGYTTLITGGSRGIGAAIAERLTHEGHVVINLSRSPPGSDFSGVSYSVDLADAQALKAKLADIVSRHEIDHLVNNAGLADISPIEEVDLPHIKKMLFSPRLSFQA